MKYTERQKGCCTEHIPAGEVCERHLEKAVFFFSFSQKVTCEWILAVMSYNIRIQIYTRKRKGHDEEYLYSGKLEAF